jgi:sensor histidine kinase YesM
VPGSFTRRARIAYYVAWVPMAALVAVVLHLRGMPWTLALAIGLPLCVPFALVCGSSYYMARAMPLRGSRLAQVLTSLLASSVLVGGLWAVLALAVANALPGSHLMDQLGILFGMGVGYFVLSLIFHYLILAMEETRRIEDLEKEARVLAREAELRALKFQINPHFLFNSLNAIAALTSTSPEQARRMCQLLSSFLRDSLRLSDRRSIPLREELSLVRTYLDIELVRFADRLGIDEHVDESCLGEPIPPLLLQPLVENAVKHGISALEDGGTIDLSVARDPGLTIRIENPLDPGSPARPGTGRGLAIVEERLTAFYGKHARMVVDRRPGSFLVRLEIPGDAG